MLKVIFLFPLKPVVFRGIMKPKVFIMKYFVYIIYLYVILVLGGKFMNNNLSKEQLEIKERLERIINIFTYRYIKAGTKSKKKLNS